MSVVFSVCIIVVLYDHVFFPICEHCACMSKFFSPPGPLVFPGPIFMNQREQALARIRPLQALRHKRDKHKGTMVFTNSMGAETPLLTHLPIWLSRPPPLSLSEGRTRVFTRPHGVKQCSLLAKRHDLEKMSGSFRQGSSPVSNRLVLLCIWFGIKLCMLAKPSAVKIWCAMLIHFLVQQF